MAAIVASMVVASWWMQVPLQTRAVCQVPSTPRLGAEGQWSSLIANLRRDATAAVLHSITGPPRERLLSRLELADRDLRARAEAAMADQPADRAAASGAGGESARLLSELHLARIDLASLATELLADEPGRAAATAARGIEVAQRTLPLLPTGGPVTEAVWRQMAELHLIAGDFDSAGQIVDAAAEKFHVDRREPGQGTAAWDAIEVRLAIGRGDLAAAAQRLERWPPNRSTVTLELARLGYYLATDQPAAVADQIARIRDRFGDAAARRAESIAARRGGPSDPRSTPLGVVLADVRSHLAAGDTSAAVVLLARQSVQRARADEAFELSTLAVGLLRSTRPAAAASLLRSVVVKFPDAPPAAATMLAAIELDADAGQGPAEIDDELRSLQRQWPTSEAALAAIDWRVELAGRAGAPLRAATIAAEVPLQRWRSTDSQRCLTLWAAATRPFVAGLDPWQTEEARDEQGRQLAAAVESLRSTLGRRTDPPAVQLRTWLLANFAARSMLTALDAADRTTPYLQFRLSDLGHAVPAIESLTDDERRRLTADAILDPARAEATGRVLIRLPSEAGGEPFEPVVLSHWIRDWEGGQRWVERLTDASANRADLDPATVHAAAGWACQTGGLAAAARSADHWAIAAASLDPATAQHHHATLMQCRMLVIAGDRPAAMALARYTLLTNPPADRRQTQQYESMAEPFG